MAPGGRATMPARCPPRSSTSSSTCCASPRSRPAAGDPADLARAAEWVVRAGRRRGRRGGARADGRQPARRRRAARARADAPTVLIYGHYDVQSPNPLDAWTHALRSSPTIRDGRIYARGASDDKGNFLPLLHVACRLARAGELPVHVRVLMEGEEEIGGHHVRRLGAPTTSAAPTAPSSSTARWSTERTPALTLGLRGIVQIGVDVRTARATSTRACTAAAALNAAARAARDAGRGAPRPRRACCATSCAPASCRLPPTRSARGRCLPGGARELAVVGGRGLHPDAVRDYYRRNWRRRLARPQRHRGRRRRRRTIIPATARATLSIRLAPRPALSGDPRGHARTPHARGGARGGRGHVQAIRERRTGRVRPGHPRAPALPRGDRTAQRHAARPGALGRVDPELAAFADRGIPCALSGFALPADDVHAPDETYRLRSLELGEAAARAAARAALRRVVSRARAAGVVALLAALAWALAGRGLVNYDTLYALVWGRDVAHGTVPDLEVPIAPTPHPLATLGGIVLAPLSASSRRASTARRPRRSSSSARSPRSAHSAGSSTARGRVVQPGGRRARRGDRPHAPPGSRLRRARVRGHPLPRARARRAARRDAAPAGGRARARAARAGRPAAPRGVAVLARSTWPGCGARPTARAARAAVALAVAAPLLWALCDLLLTGDPLHSLLGTRDTAERARRASPASTTCR